MELLQQGNMERTQEPTKANQTSSRSHAVLQVTVKQRSRARGINSQVIARTLTQLPHTVVHAELKIFDLLLARKHALFQDCKLISVFHNELHTTVVVECFCVFLKAVSLIKNLKQRTRIKMLL